MVGKRWWVKDKTSDLCHLLPRIFYHQSGLKKRELHRHITLGSSMFWLASFASLVFFVSPKHEWERLCRPYPILPWSSDVSWQYGEVYRALAAKGQLIGANAMWIASTALVHGMGVVTNNVEEFSRVPGLIVVPY
jgi:hypothetical protein